METTSSSQSESNHESELSDAEPAAKKAKGSAGEQMATKNRDDKDNTGGGDAEHGRQGSTSRMPKEGQNVSWRAPTGQCEGKLMTFSLFEFAPE